MVTETEIFEAKVIRALWHMAEANVRLTKALQRGRLDSDITAAKLELRAAVNTVEGILS